MALLVPVRALDPESTAYPKGYHKGNLGGLPAVETDLVHPNVKYGIRIFGVDGSMVQWVYDLSFPELARLVIPPPPGISLSVSEDHSGGEHTVTPSLVVPDPPVIGLVANGTTVNACGGAVAHNDDVGDIDETAAANDGVANDMNLLQADGALADWYALGFASKFDAVCVNVGTPGAGSTVNMFQYSKGAGAWGNLTALFNQINNWQTAGKVWFTFERPADWAVDTIAGIANMYWIKFQSSATGGYTQPLGTQAWILVYV